MAKYKKIIVLLTENTEKRLTLALHEKIGVFIHSNEKNAKEVCHREAMIIDKNAIVMLSEKLQVKDFESFMRTAVNIADSFQSDVVIFADGPIKDQEKNSYRTRNGSLLIEFR